MDTRNHISSLEQKTLCKANGLPCTQCCDCFHSNSNRVIQFSRRQLKSTCNSHVLRHDELKISLHRKDTSVPYSLTAYKVKRRIRIFSRAITILRCQSQRWVGSVTQFGLYRKQQYPTRLSEYANQLRKFYVIQDLGLT